jgi:deoxyhypusine synthase
MSVYIYIYNHVFHVYIEIIQIEHDYSHYIHSSFVHFGGCLGCSPADSVGWTKEPRQVFYSSVVTSIVASSMHPGGAGVGGRV